LTVTGLADAFRRLDGFFRQLNRLPGRITQMERALARLEVDFAEHKRETRLILDALALPPVEEWKGQPPFIPNAAPGERVSLTLDQLWGNYTYQVGVRLEDRCDNRSPLTADEVSTPRQEFATVDGLCFVATAAYGANWTAEVQALRWARDAYLRANPLTHGLVQIYYAWSPGFARIIEANPVARAGVRVLLKPLANLARASTSGR